MRIYLYPSCNWKFVRILPQLSVSIENDHHFDLFLYVGWLIIGFELNLCWSK